MVTVEAKDWPFAEVAEDPMIYPLGSLLPATLLVEFYWYRLANCGTSTSWQIVAGTPLIWKCGFHSSCHLRLPALAWEYWSYELSYLKSSSHLLSNQLKGCEISEHKVPYCACCAPGASLFTPDYSPWLYVITGSDVWPPTSLLLKTHLRNDSSAKQSSSITKHTSVVTLRVDRLTWETYSFSCFARLTLLHTSENGNLNSGCKGQNILFLPKKRPDR